MENGHTEVAAGTTARDTIQGTQEIEVTGETAGAAAAAQAQALVTARYGMAIRRPRDWDDVRVRLLKECKRTSLAEVAIYSKPVGGSKPIEGMSIRFVETALRVMGNVASDVMAIYDNRERRILRIATTDLESNTTYVRDITVEKVVERRSANGREVISSRRNSGGQTVYLVAATDDELLNKEGALISKALRTNGLRIIPGDLVDECENQLRTTMRERDKADPDAARRKLADGFMTLSILPSELAKFLGHEIGTASPAEIEELRQVFTAIKQGEVSWKDALAAKTDTPLEEERPKPDAKTQALKEQLDKKKPAAKADAPAAQAKTDDKAPAPEGDDDGYGS